MAKKEKSVMISVRLSADTVRSLQSVAYRKRTTVSSIIREAVAKYVEN